MLYKYIINMVDGVRKKRGDAETRGCIIFVAIPAPVSTFVYRVLPSALLRHSSLFQGQPFSLAHIRTFNLPHPAAARQVSAFQGQPFSRAHRSTFKWPPCAASEHIDSSQA